VCCCGGREEERRGEERTARGNFAGNATEAPQLWPESWRLGLIREWIWEVLAQQGQAWALWPSSRHSSATRITGRDRYFVDAETTDQNPLSLPTPAFLLRTYCQVLHSSWYASTATIAYFDLTSKIAQPKARSGSQLGPQNTELCSGTLFRASRCCRTPTKSAVPWWWSR
jgi:hypothetical protein